MRGGLDAEHPVSPFNNIEIEFQIRFLLKVDSSNQVMRSSFNFRIGSREVERYKFLANCWVMVVPPLTMKTAPLKPSKA